MSTRPLRDDSGWSCDWGGCDNGAVAERTNGDEWLPVCTVHLGPQKRGPGPRGTCPVCATDHALSMTGLIRAHDRGFAIRCPGTGKEPR